MKTATVIEKPMLFSGPMVRAILDGRKTQTRRIVKFRGPEQLFSDLNSAYPDAAGTWIFWTSEPSEAMADATKRLYNNEGYMPPHPVGSRIWVREAHAIVPLYSNDRGQQWSVWGGLPYTPNPELRKAAYYREGFDRSAPVWRPSIHMPRWACRITLKVTAVRVQRLQDITPDDAHAEGIKLVGEFFQGATHPIKGTPKCFYDPRQAFESIWKSIHGPESWQANPWVWAYTFEVVEGR